MPHYIVLGNLTDEGAKNVKDLPRQIQMANQKAAAAGIKFQRFFTLGVHDIVVLVEAPNDEAVAMTALAIAGQGHIRTTTLKAFTEEEFIRILERMPSS